MLYAVAGFVSFVAGAVVSALYFKKAMADANEAMGLMDTEIRSLYAKFAPQFTAKKGKTVKK
ncbi:MAG: hypothetical protein ACRD3D_01030 [Terriglobia bacterium]